MLSKEEIAEKFKKIPLEVKRIVEKRLELFALEFGDQIAEIFSQILYRLTGVILIALGSIFLLQSLALFLGDLLNDQSLGYLIVSLPIVILGVAFALLRPKAMVRKTKEKMTDQILKSFKKDGN